jgi:erythromycin esterase
MRKLFCAAFLLGGVIMFADRVPLAQQPTAPAARAEAQPLGRHKPVERELKAGETHAYEIALEAGQFLDAAVNQRGIDVVVRVFAPDGKLLAEIDSPNGTQGDEPIALQAKAAGAYRIEVVPNEEGGSGAAGRYEIRVNEILSADAYAERLAAKKREQRQVIEWLKENAIPVKTVEAGNGFDDLQPLKRLLKDVRVVGLGEETHGTREFFQFKHRMVEFLVKEMGFRVFAIEASYAACQNINDYVNGKTDDGAKALDSQGFWTWNTEEVRAMLDWMRAYNASVTPGRRVKFVGFDIQGNDKGKAELLAYLKRVAPERAAEAEGLFQVNEGKFISDAFAAQGEEAEKALARLRELKSRYDDLFVFLELRGAELASKSGREEYEQMREYARVMAQFIDAFTHRDWREGVTLRDLYMADNFRRVVEREPEGTRFVVWAHNGHVATGNSDGTYVPFGTHLRRFFGKEYYALGFSFDRGAFQAMGRPPNDQSAKMTLMSFNVGPAPDGWVEWYLAQTDVKSFIIDFRSPRKSAGISEWLSAPHMMRSIGSTYGPGFERDSFGTFTLGKEFDGLFFIDTTTRARPTHPVK